MNTIMSSKKRLPMAERKGAGVLPTHDRYHQAAAATYRGLCSAKKLAYAWKIDASTARKYRLGLIIGALTRLLWEIVLLERAGIRTTAVWALLRRAALEERRRYRQLQPARRIA